MPPTDASTDAGTAPVADPRPTSGTDCEDTLDLRLPDDLIAFFGGTPDPAGSAGGSQDPGGAGASRGHGAAAVTVTAEDHQHADATGGRRDDGRRDGGPAPAAPAAPVAHAPARDDLLGGIGGWGPTDTPVGVFHLVPVRVEHDLPLVSRWMNDPAVAAFWELAGPESVTEEHLRRQFDGDGRSVPCLGLLDGTPMSYWEIYRADLDHLARHYPARPHDTGVHLLVGEVAHRGRGLGSALLRAAADLVLDRRPSCARVVAEPDLRNVPSVSAFLSAGFRFSAEVDLPGKRAALMVRDRALRALL